MTAPTATAWAPPPSETGRPPALDSWLVADWLLAERDARGYARQERVDLCLRVLERAGMRVSRQYLYGICVVARAFPPERRRPSLTFSHHREVSHLDAEQADAALELAEREGWGCVQLREHLRARRGAA